MPLYEFECLECHSRFEALVRDSSRQTCPACRSGNLQRILSLFSVSSEGTRQASLAKARQAQSKVRKDKAVAEHEEAHHHH